MQPDINKKWKEDKDYRKEVIRFIEEKYKIKFSTKEFYDLINEEDFKAF